MNQEPNRSTPGSMPCGPAASSPVEVHQNEWTGQHFPEEASPTTPQRGHGIPQHSPSQMSQAREQVQQTVENTRHKAHQYVESAKVRGTELLDQQKHRAADQLHTVGAAVHRAADKFRQERDDNIAGYVDAVADEVDHLADYLDQRPPQALVRGAQNFARREPEWFLGGMFLAGLALTRFLKASQRSDGRDDFEYRAGFASRPQQASEVNYYGT